MSTADIALARQQEGSQESAFPWLALLPLALIPLFGTSAEGLQRILLMVQAIFFFLGMRRPVWILAVLATVGARLGLVLHGANRKKVPGFDEPQEGVCLGGLGHERS